MFWHTQGSGKSYSIVFFTRKIHRTVGGNYTFAWLGDNKIDQTRALVGRIAGDYDAYIHIFGLSGSFRF